MNSKQIISLIQGTLILLTVLAIFFKGRISRKLNINEFLTIIIIFITLFLCLYIIKKLKIN